MLEYISNVLLLIAAYSLYCTHLQTTVSTYCTISASLINVSVQLMKLSRVTSRVELQDD